MKSSRKKIQQKSGQTQTRFNVGKKVFDGSYGMGVVSAVCGNTLTVAFKDKVAYYYADGTEIGNRMLGDKPGALLDDLYIDEGVSCFKRSFRRWLFGSKA